MAITGGARYVDSGFGKPYDPGHDNVTYVDLTVGGTVTTLSFSSGAGLPTGTAPIATISVQIRAWMSEGFGNPSSTNFLTLKYKTFTLVTLAPTANTTAGDLGFSSGAWNTINPETGVAWTTTDLFGANNFTVTYTRGAGGNARSIGVLECYLGVEYTVPNASVTPSSGANGDTITIAGGGLHAFIYTGGSSGGLPTAGVYVWDGISVYSATVIVLTDDSLTFTVPSGWATGANFVYVQTYDGVSIDFNYLHFPTTSFTKTAATWWYIPELGWYELSIGQPADVTYDFVTYSWGAAAAPGPGWWQSTNDYAGQAINIASGRPHNPRFFTEIAAFATTSAAMLGGMPGAGCVFDNKLVYPSGGYTVGTDYPSIRVWDGHFDRGLCTVPATSAGAVPKAVMSMIAANGKVYFSTLDSGTSSADYVGRVFSLSIETGNMVQVGATFPAGHVPYALAWHLGRLWCGTHRSSSASAGKIYYIRPDQDTAWTDDYTLSSSSMAGCTSLCSYKGVLYVGTGAAAATFAKVLARDTAGAYTTADTGSGGAATANNCWPYMLEYNGDLYASYWNNDATAIAKVRKLSGGSWSTSYTGSGGTLRPYIGMVVDNGGLYVMGGGLALTGTLLWYNGSSWTDVTAFITDTGTSFSAQPVFGVLVL